MTASSGRPAPAGRDILAGGRKGLTRLPSADDLAAQPAAERHALLDDLRDELYALSAVVADEAVRRARQGRSGYPPYGLVRSLFTQMRVVADEPSPYEEGSIDSFVGLGRAYMDTVVFYLEREIVAVRASERSWLLGRLEELLVLYRINASAPAQARIRDPFSFLYGGLHFGTSVCVQMAEVMNRMLTGAVDLNGATLTAREKAEVVRRSTRALYQLTAINIEDIPSVYRHLLAPADGPASGWLSPDRFEVQLEDGRPRRIDIKPGVVAAGAGGGGVATSGPGEPVDPQAPARGALRFTTRGCPARGSPSGGAGAIATMWNWCIDLARDTGLINDA